MSECNAQLRLVRLTVNNKRHASLADVNEFEESILEHDNLRIIPEFNNKLLKKFARPFLVGLFNKFLPKYQTPIFYIAMGISEVNRSIPFSLLSPNNVLYLFDAWPMHHELIAEITEVYNITLLFVTSKESAEKLSLLLKRTKVFWCPEGCRPINYKPYDYNSKDIDVLQFGRKYDNWHNIVVDDFYKLHISYLYEKKKGDIIFRERKDFIDGLGRTKISICFPKSVTHPSSSGGLSTMTYRYLQSMASKCLILGVTPDEMKDIFGYDPVIFVDMKDPVGQVQYILKNFNDFIPLVERNYQEVIVNHSWYSRWKRISEIIKSQYE